MRLHLVAIAGTSSNVGKTTLLCELLRALTGHEGPGGAGTWEAIKLTRGHYRSCGKDPHACCVSDLLSSEPTIRSGRRETYTPGKDTARYWEAGASNVHWVVVTNDQVEQGMKQALERVRTPNVLIEGTCFLKFIKADLAVLVGREGQEQLKPTARFALSNGLIDAIYGLNDQDGERLRSQFELPFYTQRDLPQLVNRIHRAIG
jgi:molybdopterin-guanine dinucleotide biosynthesis protein